MFIFLLITALSSKAKQEEHHTPLPAEQHDTLNVYMSISYTPPGSETQTTEQINIKLYHQECPITVKNFHTILTRKERSYQNSIFHRIIPGFMIQGGDVLNGNGTGSTSIYGEMFADENFKFPHNKPGLLSMANRGKDTNGSQFFITLAKTPWLDGKHVVFGEVDEESLNVIKRISGVETGRNDDPLHKVTIVKCGDVDEGFYEPEEEGKSETEHENEIEEVDSGIDVAEDHDL